MAGPVEDLGHSSGGDGHAEAVSQGQRRVRAAYSDPARQVPHHAPPGRSTEQGKQGRVSASFGQGIDRVRQLQAKVFREIQLSGLRNQTLGEIGVDAPIVLFVDICQGGTTNRLAESNVR